jgi:probable phosphoglycerate mutase
VELLLVRHAEPVRIPPGRTAGAPADPPLTPAGRAQAARLAAWWRPGEIDHVVTSPRARAYPTAEPLAERLGCGLEVIDGLREYDAAADHYLPVEELRARRDDRWQAMVEGRWEDYGGEDPGAFTARVRDVLGALVGAHPGRRVAVVCHGGVINVYLADVLGLARPLWFEPAYTSVSRVRANRDGVRSVVSVNETAHLDATRDRVGEASG